MVEINVFIASKHQDNEKGGCCGSNKVNIDIEFAVNVGGSGEESDDAAAGAEEEQEEESAAMAMEEPATAMEDPAMAMEEAEA